MSEWDRLWKEVYGDPISEIAIKTKALGDEMQKNLATCEGIVKGLLEDRTACWKKLEAIRNHIKTHRAEMPMIIWTIPEADPKTKIEKIDSAYVDWFEELKKILEEKN